MTRFFPLLDAVKIKKKRLRRFVKKTELDMSKHVYIANDDLFCKKCKKTIKKYNPVYVEFYFANNGEKKGLWSIGKVLCMACAPLKEDPAKVEYFEL